ncbi:MAG: hypothetical protein RMK18_03795 [Armatimonadota bacterium]|nr:hypothetical protein [Armatimonadota bacterium]MCX7778030.1 hypothetical protein [Armatimonadota bacterium]MDW8024972.1 hypothetical protein [Armatimonadota bacterium]
MQVIAAVILLLGVLSYFSEPSRYERQIERIMRSLFPNSKSIQVKVKGHGGLKALRGELDLVEITVVGAKAKSDALAKFIAYSDGNQPGEETVTPTPSTAKQRVIRQVGYIANVALKFSDCEFDGMPFAELTVELSKVRYDLNKLLDEHRIWLIDLDEGWFSLKLSSSFICSIVEGKMAENGFIQARAKLDSQKISVESYYPIWWLRVPFSVSGVLHVVPPCSVAFKPESLKVFSVIPVPASTVEWLIGRAEFSFELAFMKLPLEPHLTSVRAAEDVMEFRGILRLPAAKGAEL